MKVHPEVELMEISLGLLDDHPLNPRIIFREDVIEALAACMGSGFEKQYAMHVRPVGERYQILAGHHRKRAAVKAGLDKAWCWVQTMDDDEAYMALATSNNQGELGPLEIGLHALHCVALSAGGRGKKGGLSEYAARVGRDHSTITQYVQAAEVAEAVKGVTQVTGLLDKAKHLAAIHGLPQSIWQAAVEHVVKAELSKDEVIKRVANAKEFIEQFDPGRWG